MNWNQIKRKSGGERERKKKGYQSIREQTNKQERNDNLYILFIEDSNYSIAKKKIGLKTDNFENKLKNSIQMHPCISLFFINLSPSAHSTFWTEIKIVREKHENI